MWIYEGEGGAHSWSLKQHGLGLQSQPWARAICTYHPCSRGQAAKWSTKRAPLPCLAPLPLSLSVLPRIKGCPAAAAVGGGGGGPRGSGGAAGGLAGAALPA